MGVFYKAHQLVLDRPLALKTLHPTLSNAFHRRMVVERCSGCGMVPEGRALNIACPGESPKTQPFENTKGHGAQQWGLPKGRYFYRAIRVDHFAGDMFCVRNAATQG